MKIGYWALLSGACLGVVTGCGDAEGASGVEDVSSVEQGLAACPAGASCVTKTLGNITVRYYTCGWSGSGQRNSATCTVDSDFVLVGGGAEIKDNGEPGALLTASYPEGDSRIARSKDHIRAYPHQTRAYAIGLRLAGLNKANLQKSVKTVLKAVGPTAHPSATIVAPAGELILSGGA